jgi:hypothetical protein
MYLRSTNLSRAMVIVAKIAIILYFMNSKLAIFVYQNF